MSILGHLEPKGVFKYFEEISRFCDFKHWYFGHYHDDRQIGEKFSLLYDEIIPLD